MVLSCTFHHANLRDDSQAACSACQTSNKSFTAGRPNAERCATWRRYTSAPRLREVSDERQCGGSRRVIVDPANGAIHSDGVTLIFSDACTSG